MPREVDFTPAQIRRSDQCFTSPDAATPNLNSTTRDFFGTLPITQGFDGNDTTWAAPNDNGAWTIYRPEPTLEDVTSLRILSGNLTDIWINGASIWNQVTQDATANVEYNCDAALTGGVDITSIAVKCDSSGRNSWRQITANNQVLTNPFIWSATLRYSSGTDNGELVTNAQNAFDNSLSTSTTGEFNANMRWIPETDIVVTNSLRINVGNNMMLNFNGSNIGSASGQQWLEYPGPFPATINADTPLVIGNAGDTPRLFAIEVDGQVIQNGVNSSFGANGFHLTFEDPNDLGKDSSGNGNDFTATGFNTDPVRVYSTNCFTINNPAGADADLSQIETTTVLNGVANPPSEGFDGDTNIAFLVASGNAPVVRFDPPIENVTQVTVSQFTGQGTAINGVDDTTTSAGNGADEIHYDGAAITLESVAVWHRAGDNGGWWRIGVTQDGVQRFLVDNTGTDYDLMQDGPSQNYATGNPLMYGINGGTRIMSYADGNLKFGGGGPSSLPWTYPTIRVPMGVRAYAEFVNTFGAITSTVGVSQERPTTDGDWGSRGTWSWGLDYRTWVKDPDGNNDTTNVPGNWTQTAGSVAGVEVNTTASPPTVTFTLNGANPKTFTFDADFDPDNIWIGGNFSVNEVTQNFGQQPFLFQPEGTIALQTENLPTAPIKNGRDHFQTIVTGGQNISSGITTVNPTGAGKNYTFSGSWGTTQNNNAAELNANNIPPAAITVGANITTSDAKITFNPSISAKSLNVDGFTSNTLVAVTTENTYTRNAGTGLLTFNDTENIESITIGCTFNTGQSMVNDITLRNGSRAPFSDNITEITVEDGTLFSVGDRVYEAEDITVFGYVMAINGNVLSVSTENTFTVGHNLVVEITSDNILALSRTTFPNGLWWIKARKSDTVFNNHQLVDSVRGQVNGNWQALYSNEKDPDSNFIAPGLDCVSWCWNAGGPAVANNDGSTASQVSANTNAGFSIISYTGTGSNTTIGHGLDKAPEFILCKNRQRTINWTGYHIGTDPNNPQNYYISLNTSEPANNDSNMWVAKPTNSVISVGEYNFNNASGEDFIMYAWHSVPGYSSFGMYVGGGGDNGPFISTEFRPAYVLLKGISTTNGWLLMDSTISPYNPSTSWFNPDESSPEQSAATPSVDIDFLSNGLKIRNSDNAINQAGMAFVYAIFAENPFGGSNVSPVTAR